MMVMMTIVATKAIASEAKGKFAQVGFAMKNSYKY